MAPVLPAQAEVRAQAYRLRFAPSRVFSCRACHAAVRVSGARSLPESCPTCGVTTWERDGRCANWVHCDVVRPPGVRGRPFCPACGFSVWVGVHDRARPPREGRGARAAG